VKRRLTATAALAALLVLASTLVTGAAVASDTPAVQVSNATATPDDPTVGETVTVQTTVANLETGSDTVHVTDVYLRKSGGTHDYVRVEDVGSIAPGGTMTVPLTTSFASAGEKHLTVHVVVEDGNGTHAYTYPLLVDVDDATVRAGLDANVTDAGAATVELTDYGTADFENVSVTASHDGTVVGETYVYDVASGTSGTATFDVSDVDGGTVTFTATYDANGETHERSTSVDTTVGGQIRLTGVDVSQAGATVTLEGDAANVGGTDADAVLLGVADGDGVRGTTGGGEYFVGAVDASEFATFELDATVANGTDSVPVEISYLVDGERVTTTQSVSLGTAGAGAAAASGSGAPAASGGSAPSGQGPPGSSGLSIPVVPILGGLGVVVVVAAGVLYYRWNRE